MPLKYVVCAIIEKDGLFLIAQRPYGKSLGGKWEFPGGKIEINESEQEALRREIREELGVDRDIGIRLTPSTHDYPDFTVHLIPYLCRIISGDPFLMNILHLPGSIQSQSSHMTLPLLIYLSLKTTDYRQKGSQVSLTYFLPCCDDFAWVLLSV